MYGLRVKTHFQAAHYLPDYPGKCARLHGHTWQVEVMVAGKELNVQDLLLDLGQLKLFLAEVVEPLDHSLLNEVAELGGRSPSAENLARYVFEALAALLPPGVRLEEVWVWESDTAGASYRGEDG